MLSSAIVQKTLSRYPASEMFPPLAVKDGKLFFLQGDKHKETYKLGREYSYLGACMIGMPMIGADDSTVDRLKSTLSNSFPPGTFVQISMLSVPYVDDIFEKWLNDKINAIRRSDILTPEQKEQFPKIAEAQHAYFMSGKEKPLLSLSGVLSNRQLIVASIKIPTHGPMPTDEEEADAEKFALKLENGLHTSGLMVSRASPNEYLSMLRFCFMPYRKYDDSYDEDEMLRAQILEPGFHIDTEPVDRIVLNQEAHAKCLSLKANGLPKYASFDLMSMITGDPSGVNNQLPTPYMITLTLMYPDQVDAKDEIRTKHRLINYQAFGPMLKWNPRLGYKKEGFDIMSAEIEKGAVICQANLTVTLYGENAGKVEKTASEMIPYYSALGFDFVEEKTIGWGVFYNTLPLFPSADSVKDMRRSRTLSVNQAVRFVPALGDWGGSGAGSPCIFQTRKGQPFLFDLYGSSSNYNAVVLAESGGGKSYLLQKIIRDYLLAGAKVWVIDIGRSYLKLCNKMGGEFIEFSEDSRICLNPFTNVIDINEDTDVLKTLLAKMAAPENGLSEIQMANLEEAIKATWGHKGNSMTVTDVADYLMKQVDPDTYNIGKMLYPFTRNGSYGQWFDGVNNLDFSRNFVVLELEDLKQKTALLKVVQLLLITKIQYAMYLTDNSIKKICVIDEAKETIEDDPGAAKFLNSAYSRFRKYGGSAITVFQSATNFFGTERFSTMRENTANYMLLQQTSSAVESLERGGFMPVLKGYGFHQLKTVHTLADKGHGYSEVMFVQNSAYGVARLTVNRYDQVLFSTKGAERTEVLDLVRRGVPIQQAIEQFISTRG